MKNANLSTAARKMCMCMEVGPVGFDNGNPHEADDNPHVPQTGVMDGPPVPYQQSSDSYWNFVAYCHMAVGGYVMSQLQLSAF